MCHFQWFISFSIYFFHLVKYSKTNCSDHRNEFVCGSSMPLIMYIMLKLTKWRTFFLFKISSLVFSKILLTYQCFVSFYFSLKFHYIDQLKCLIFKMLIFKKICSWSFCMLQCYCMFFGLTFYIINENQIKSYKKLNWHLFTSLKVSGYENFA